MFLIPILHQTTTTTYDLYTGERLFLIPILHQTTTITSITIIRKGCSSFQFYIKPQLSSYQNGYKYVVPHSNSTSNHNDYEHYDYPEGLFLIPILHQTTTCRRGNLLIMRCSSFQFYIKPQLNFLRLLHLKGCSSFQFYIKPQLSNTQVCLHRCCSSFQFYIKPQLYEDSVIPISVVPHSNSTSNHNFPTLKSVCIGVVPHSNSTSNHNCTRILSFPYRLFLIPILHQTTTTHKRR